MDSLADAVAPDKTAAETATAAATTTTTITKQANLIARCLCAFPGRLVQSP